jgi:hypothetical protein
MLVLLSLNKSAHGQCLNNRIIFQAGEKLTYNVAYNLGVIYVDAGKVSFEVKDDVYAGKKVFHFYSYGNSLPSYDWFFKVKDIWEAYSDTAKIQPYYFKRNSSEGGYNVNNSYWYDYENKKIYSQSENTNKAMVKDTFQLKPCTFDLVSALYYVRNLDFSKYKPNEKINLSLIVDNEIYPDLYMRFLGKEEITLHSGVKYLCYKVKPNLVAGTMFSGGEKMTVWISTDGNNVPILIEAEVIVGSIKAEIEKTIGLKKPLLTNTK